VTRVRKPIINILLVVVTYALFSYGALGQETADKPIETTIKSAIMNEDRSLVIHLPRHYQKDVTQKYPVMYVLDGTSQDQHTADTIDTLANAGLIPRAVVVGIPNTRGNRERDQTPPFMRRNVDDDKSPFGEADKFLSFIKQELIPYIDAQYRTSGSRMISGNSRGGLFVLYTLIEAPELFQARFCYSTPVWRFDNLIVKKVASALGSSKRAGGFLFVAAGEKETDNIILGTRALQDVLGNVPKKRLTSVVEFAQFADHQDNAAISTGKGLRAWSSYILASRYQLKKN